MDTTNEPVAWMVDRVLFTSLGAALNISFDIEQPCIPLYTHPVKELDEQFKKGFEAGKEEGWKAHKFHHPVKELTDEEIIELGDKHLVLVNEYIGCGDYVSNIEGEIEFARAILRKAQEK
jgi:hypothetical protein